MHQSKGAAYNRVRLINGILRLFLLAGEWSRGDESGPATGGHLHRGQRQEPHECGQCLSRSSPHSTVSVLLGKPSIQILQIYIYMYSIRISIIYNLIYNSLFVSE